MLRLKENLKEKIRERLKDKSILLDTELEISSPPDRKMGDLAMTFPFHLARKFKKPSRQVALDLLPSLLPLEGVEKGEVAGAGYINLFLDRKAFFREQLLSIGKGGLSPEEEKIIIEHTNINPNKAAHIGHLRNACLGDTLARCLKYKGENVEIQNYIDDTGAQVVDVVLGFIELEKKTLADIEKIDDKFDFYCWDLYSRVSSYLEDHPEVQPRKAEILRKIERGENPEWEFAHHISRRILRAHLATMRRIGVTYDLLPCESSILRLKFWEKAFALLKEKDGIRYATEGENKGCWVMSLEEEAEKEKIIVRSDGTVTYVGKDIAYQLWKFGLLDRDFYYEPFMKDGEKTIWITTSTANSGKHSFGKAGKVFNVIDTRQSYLQKVVVQGLKSLKYFDQADKSVHFSYEMVALSPKSLKELDYEAAEDEKDRAFLEVSGRKGLGVKADDLLDRLEEKALVEVEKRNPDLRAETRASIAHQIASGALRYFMLKYARNSIIVFDFDEALNFEGETGPYLQYALVRINSIFRKLEEREGFDEEAITGLISAGEILLNSLPEKEMSDFWDLVFYAAQFEEEILHSVSSLEFSHLAKFTFNLCQKFNTYYHLYTILAEENRERKLIRILTIHYVRDILRRALDLMGIPLPERM